MLFLEKIAAGGLMVAFLHASALAATGNMLKNGDFENGTASWKFGDRIRFVASDTWVYDGDLAIMGSCRPISMPCFSGSYSFVRQMVPTVAGTSYDLSFWAKTGGSVGEIVIDWGGQQLEKHTLFTHSDYRQYGYEDLVATGAETELTIFLANHQSLTFTAIDDILLVAQPQGMPPIAEPPVYAMLLAGLAGLGVVACRRSRQAA